MPYIEYVERLVAPASEAKMYTAANFKEGDRVELHPATDLWIRGARFGTVDRITRNGVLVVFVDRLNHQVRINPENIYEIL